MRSLLLPGYNDIDERMSITGDRHLLPRYQMATAT